MPTCSSTASATRPTRHRKVGNLFDVKLRAIDNLHEAGVDIVPVTTIINGINNEQVGRIIQFALDNPKKINFAQLPAGLLHRPRRRRHRRAPRRAALHPVATWPTTSRTRPASASPSATGSPSRFMSTFSDWADLVHGPNADWGQLSCGCHPNCGIGMALMIDKETKEAVPVTAFLECRSVWPRTWPRSTTPPAASSSPSSASTLALLRNYDPFQVAHPLQDHSTCCKKFDKCFGATGRNYGKVTGDRTMADIEKRRADRWNFLFIAGMWFQDLFNYDFRRTEQCIIPYATQEGEISFCAYNTGVGWRNIIEKMHMTATLTKWYEEHGRHEIFAGGKKVGMNNATHDLVLNKEHVTASANDTLDKLGIAKNSREEKIRARDEKIKSDAENAKMARLYREHVLGEKAQEGFIPLDTLIAPAPKVAPKAPSEEPVMGD